MSAATASPRRAIETTGLVLIGVLLAVATIHDVASQVRVNHRLIADLSTWRATTGHDYHNLSVEQNIEHRGTREVVCGNTSPGAPKTRVRVCLTLTGPVVDGRRKIVGGWYLPPLVEDVRHYRYACFGSALRGGLCGMTKTPPGYPDTPLLRGP